MLRFILLILVVGLGTSWVEVAHAMSPQERYELGQKYMRRGYYQKAMEHFSVLRNSHRDSDFSTKAELAMADVYFKQGEYDLARVAYEDFSRLHPRHSDLDYAVYRLGLSHYRKASRIAARDQTWTQQAVHAWANFSRRFPDSEYAEEVEAAVRASRGRLARTQLGLHKQQAPLHTKSDGSIESRRHVIPPNGDHRESAMRFR